MKRTLASLLLVVALTGCNAPKVEHVRKPVIDTSVVSDRIAASRARTMIAPMPSLVILPANTNGAVYLEWTAGNPRETTITNLTTGKSLYVGNFTSATFKGLTPGSNYTLAVFNSVGMSQFLTVTAKTNQPGLNLMTADDAYLVRWQNGFLQRSADLVTWNYFAGLSPAIVTNTGTGLGFFRSLATNSTAQRSLVKLERFTFRLSWPVLVDQSQRLQKMVNQETESFADVISFVAIRSELFMLITTNAGRYRVIQGGI